MKASINTDGSFTVTVEGHGSKDLFEQISAVQELFGDLVCRAKVDKKGAFGKGDDVESSDVRLQVRQAGKYTYYEAVCMEDGPLKYAKKKFGVYNDDSGNLFPKAGWTKWDKDKEVDINVLTGEAVEE